MDKEKDINKSGWNIDLKRNSHQLAASDSAELIVRVEDCFGIKISDKEALEIYTIGELFKLVLRKLGQKPGPNDLTRACLTARTFYRLRLGLLGFKHCEGMRIRPDTPIEQVLPAKNRRKLWPELAKNIGLKLPRLRRSAGIRKLVIPLCIIWIVAGWQIVRLVFPAGFYPSPSVEIFFAITFSGLAFILILWMILTCHLVRTIPDCRNVGDLARDILGDNHAVISQEVGQGKIAQAEMSEPEKQVWAALLYIIADITYIKESELKPGDQFVKDLDFD
ncbi:MAG: acyl carrier protein [Planctomycetes bacterium]|nr:acyl carrier protein [Planctomycetota bacterium]